MTCSPIDFICVIRNDLVGDTLLSILFVLLLYFIIAGKLRLGFETTFVALIPISLIVSLALGQFSVIYAFSTVIIGIFLGWVVIRFFEAR